MNFFSSTWFRGYAILLGVLLLSTLAIAQEDLRSAIEMRLRQTGPHHNNFQLYNTFSHITEREILTPMLLTSTYGA
jgi:hypothetical protein